MDVAVKTINLPRRNRLARLSWSSRANRVHDEVSLAMSQGNPPEQSPDPQSELVLEQIRRTLSQTVGSDGTLIHTPNPSLLGRLNRAFSSKQPDQFISNSDSYVARSMRCGSNRAVSPQILKNCKKEMTICFGQYSQED